MDAGACGDGDAGILNCGVGEKMVDTSGNHMDEFDAIIPPLLLAIYIYIICAGAEVHILARILGIWEIEERNSKCCTLP